MKPSDEFVIDEIIGKSVDVPKLANAFDKLHERLEKAESLINYYSGKVEGMLIFNKSDTKQEPKKCEHDSGNRWLVLKGSCYKPYYKDEHPNCPICPTEKRESLADVLWTEYNNYFHDQYWVGAPCEQRAYELMSQAAKDWFVRLVDEVLKEDFLHGKTALNELKKKVMES
jgi:hypothetical protein